MVHLYYFIPRFHAYTGLATTSILLQLLFLEAEAPGFFKNNYLLQGFVILGTLNMNE